MGLAATGLLTILAFGLAGCGSEHSPSSARLPEPAVATAVPSGVDTVQPKAPGMSTPTPLGPQTVVTVTPTARPQSTTTATPVVRTEHPPDETPVESQDVLAELEALILSGQYLLSKPDWQVGHNSNVRPKLQHMYCFDNGSIVDIEEVLHWIQSNSSRSNENQQIREIGSLSWIVPWGQGFLHFGYPRMEYDCYVVLVSGDRAWNARWFPLLASDAGVLFRTTSDGISWTRIEDLAVPFEFPPVGENMRLNINVKSNGEQLLVAVGQTMGVSLSITSDLTDWDTIQVQIRHPEMFNEHLSANTWVESVAVSSSGWIVGTTTEVHIGDLPIPQDILDEAIEVLTDFHDVPTYTEEGILVEWMDNNMEEKSRLVAWEELGISHDTFVRYMRPAYNRNNGRFSTPIEQFHGMVLPVLWDENISENEMLSWIELPNELTPGVCCKVVGTVGGYIAADIPYIPGGYSWIMYGNEEKKLFYSSDGNRWQSLTIPQSGLNNRRTIVIDRLFPVEEGVIVSAMLYGEKEYDGGIIDSMAWLLTVDGFSWKEIETTRYAYLADWIHASTLELWAQSIGIVWPDHWSYDSYSPAINEDMALFRCPNNSFGVLLASQNDSGDKNSLPCLSE